MKTSRVGLFFSLFIIFCLPKSGSAAVNNQLVTELLVIDNDTTFRYLYLYDTNGNKVLETKYSGQSDAWKRLTQTEWFYEGNDCVLQREKNWNVSSWNTSYEISYNYSGGNFISELHKSIKNNIPTEIKKISYQYDLSKKVTKLDSLKQNGQWILSQRADYTYIENKIDSVITKIYENSYLSSEYVLKNKYNETSVLTSQITRKRTNTEDDWLNDGMVNYYYMSGTTNLISQRNKIWDETNSVWENDQMIDYKYNDDNELISEEYKLWKSMYWNDVLKYEYSYDNQMLIQKSLLIPIYHKWRSMISIVYSDFDGNKANSVASKFDFWGGETGQFTTSFIPYLFNDEPTIQKANKIQLNYLLIDDTSIELIEKNKKENLPVYPNPSNGIYYIDTQIYNMNSWQLMDLNGRVLIKQEITEKSGVIDISEFANGIYILRVNCNERQFTQKLIKN
ncbi:MAG: T9SS type A sorting domain-containing protein [Paludibacter sp.]|nr:T9SS type A sorting domain-containing protein [Paludibacter sp.]